MRSSRRNSHIKSIGSETPQNSEHFMGPKFHETDLYDDHATVVKSKITSRLNINLKKEVKSIQNDIGLGPSPKSKYTEIIDSENKDTVNDNTMESELKVVYDSKVKIKLLTCM
jgi:hypothetical protein